MEEIRNLTTCLFLFLDDNEANMGLSKEHNFREDKQVPDEKHSSPHFEVLMGNGAAQYVSLISWGQQNEFSLLLLMILWCFSISEALGD